MAPKPIINPPTFRYPFEAEIASLTPGAQNAHRAAFQGIQDLQQAVTALNYKVGSSSPTSTTPTVENVTSFSQTVIAASTVIGKVNNQTGVIAYTTQQSDYGAFILFNDSSPIAVTLATLGSSPAVALPWFTSMINSGTGTVTITPSSGLIEGGATFQLHANNAITIVYDGTNFYVEAPGAQPQNTPQVPHEWLNSFSSITGIFGQSQPAYGDISGLGSAATYTAVGAGGYIPTGPNTSISGDIVTFTGTSGEISDSGVGISNVPLLNTSNNFTGVLNTFTSTSAPTINAVSSSTAIAAVNFTNTSNTQTWTWGTAGSAGFAGIAPSKSFVLYDSSTGVLPMYITDTAITARVEIFTPSIALTAATTATTATTGSASALPADPQGYLEINLNGTNYKIPFYNV